MAVLLVSMDLFALAKVPAGPDEAGGPPPTKFYKRRDNVVTRRALETVTSRHLHVGEIHIDRAARSVDVAGLVVELSRLEFELLVKFAGDPLRVFSKHELGRCICRGQQVNERTVDSHVCRLRTRLTSAGAEAVLVNRWGHGWSLTRQDS